MSTNKIKIFDDFLTQEENKNISWAYNICFIEKYLGKK